MTAPTGIVPGAVFGTIGALAAFPLRLAAREVERRHGQLRRGVTRRTSHVVFGRTLGFVVTQKTQGERQSQWRFIKPQLFVICLRS